MRVLVTGGTGVIGEGVIPALLKAGHEVRLLTRGAEEDAKEWPAGVEPFTADVSKRKSLKGAADDCHAVVHITGIISESPPHVTFERINVEGTRNILLEAKRSGVSRFIYVSSLGADRGRSPYHQSKRRAEEHVKEYSGDWLILRPGGVYGPGDEVISTLLKLVRASPIIPTVDGGEQRFQPIWFEDLGAAITKAIEMAELSGKTLELAGDEITTMKDVIERLSRTTGRSPAQIPVPSSIAALGAKLFDGNSLGEGVKKLTGLDVPVDEAKLTMLLEENFIKRRKRNALVDTFGIIPRPLDEGLKALADLQPEQSVTEGVGPIERKRFYVDIEKSRYSAAELLEEFRSRCVEIMPLEFQAEPGAPRVVEKGATLTASIPLRGNIQIRVEEVTNKSITFVTLEGHPLAGIVQFKTAALKPKGIRFMIEIHTRDASLLDRLAMKMGGALMQNMNWQEVVGRVVTLSGGAAPQGVQSESVTLDEKEAEQAERLVEGIVKRYKRSAKADGPGRDKTSGRKASAGKGTGKARPSKSRQKSSARLETEAKRSAGAGSKRGAPKRGRKKRQGPVKASGNVTDVVETVSQAVSSLLETVSQAASKVSRATKKKGAKRARR